MSYIIPLRAITRYPYIPPVPAVERYFAMQVLSVCRCYLAY